MGLGLGRVAAGDNAGFMRALRVGGFGGWERDQASSLWDRLRQGAGQGSLAD